ALGRFYKIRRNTILGIIAEDGLQSLFDIRCVRTGRDRGVGKGRARLPVSLAELEPGVESFAFGNEAVDVSSLAGKNVAQHSACGIVGTVRTGHAVPDDANDVGIIAGKREVFAFDGLKMNLWARRDVLSWDAAIQLLDRGDNSSRLDLPGNDQNRVVWRVPLLLKAFQHRARGGIVRRPRAESIVFVGGAPEHIVIHSDKKLVGRVGEVARNFLLDGTSLLLPLCL